jgi:hypothetical protein
VAFKVCMSWASYVVLHEYFPHIMNIIKMKDREGVTCHPFHPLPPGSAPGVFSNMWIGNERERQVGE